MGKKLITALFAALLLPYIVTLAWTGTIEGKETAPDLTSGKRIFLDRGAQGTYVDVEEYLVGIVAKQVPADFGQEVLKAQSVIARTYIYKQMGDNQEIPESALDMDYLEEKQLKELWGSDNFVTYYKEIEKAVEATKGMVLTYDGTLIDPLFHRASTGQTRNGDSAHPYLASVECAEDIGADNYLNVMSWSKEEFVEKINGIPDAAPVTADQVPETVQLISRDEAGYVKEIQIGTKTYSGEEVQYALGLPSASFTLEEFEGGMRAVTKGIGHGYGFSQYAAKCKSENGMTAEELLAYFYKDVVLETKS